MPESTHPGAISCTPAFRKVALCVSLLFFALFTAFLCRGLQQILLPNSATQAKDLRTNWTELQSVLHHVSPYRDPWTASPYPPWTFPANVAFYSPPWSLERFWFVVINLTCLMFLAGWAWSVAWSRGPFVGFQAQLREAYERRLAWPESPVALLLASSVTAISSIATGLGLGQNAILYTAFLAAALILYEAGWPILCGLMLGIAMSKINIALPFILPFVFRKDTRVVAATAAYVLGATLLVAVWVHSSPVEMMKSWLISAQRNNGVPYGPASLLTTVGMPATTAARLCAIVFLTAAVAVLATLRNLPILTLFGLAAGFGRLWTYHRVYDNVMLAFLLVALADVALRTKSRSAAIAWLLVGLTLWIPIHPMDIPPVHLIHILIWLTAMAILARAASANIGPISPIGPIPASPSAPPP